MSINIKVAKSNKEKQRVYELRYKVYIEEMKRNPKYLEGNDKEFKDIYDESAHILYAEDDEEVIGTITLHINENIPLKYIKLYKIENLVSRFPNEVSITTKFMVEEKYRKTNVAVKLAMEAFDFGKSKGILFNVIDTNPYLLRFYQRMGYRVYTNNIYHPDYGNVIPMMLIEDTDYLKDIKSPFRFIETNLDSKECIKFFGENYPEFSKIRPAFSLSKDEMWEYITDEIGIEPNESLSFLNGFSEEEAKYILKYFDILTYNKKTKLTQMNDNAREFYCILNGNVKIKMYDKNKTTYNYLLSSGDCFGGPKSPFDECIKFSAHFEEDTKLLLLNDGELDRLSKRNKIVADRFIMNIRQYNQVAIALD